MLAMASIHGSRLSHREHEIAGGAQFVQATLTWGG
jgi:hypothetical protein